jgi:integrase
MVTLGQLREDFAPRVREELLAQGKDPDVKPTHRWLREHSFWGVFTYCRSRTETVDEVLLEELGFDERPSKPLPGHSVETKRLLHTFFTEESDDFNRVNNSTVDDLPTHMRTLMRLCLDTHGHADLLKIARMDTREHYFALRDLFKKLEDHHETQGTAYNYASTLVTFYDWLEIRDEIDSHRADEIRDRFDWEYQREGPTYVLTATEVWQLWKATETLTEKVIIILMFAAGLRPDDIRVLTEDKINLDSYDPHLSFGAERKNGPGKTGPPRWR